MSRKNPKNIALPLGSAVAALGVMGGARSASAAVIYFDPSPTTSSTSVPSDAYVDIIGGVSSNSPLPGYNFDLTHAVESGKPKPTKPTINTNTGPNFTVNAGGYVAKLNAGYVISGSSNFQSGGLLAATYFGGSGPVASGPWAPPNDGTGFVGFSIEPASTPLYGWMRLTYDSSSGNLTVADWAYEDSGNSIAAGATIPEPAETVMIAALLAGSAALFARRRRKAD